MQTKNKHNEKVKMAQRMLSNKEKKAKTPKFLSKNWVNRREAISKRIQKKNKD